MSDEPTVWPIPTRILWALYRLVSEVVVRGTTVANALTGGRRPHLAERLVEWGAPADSIAPATPATPADATDPATRPVIWVHAASVGEVRAATPVLAALRGRFPDHHLLLTCNTATGRETAAGTAADEIRYLPLDNRTNIKRLLSVRDVRLMVVLETEIWPVVLVELSEAKIPCVFVNARLSERSLPRYRKLRVLLEHVMADVLLVCARDQESADRWAEIGAPADRIVVTGDVKFDGVSPESLETVPDRSGLFGGLPTLVAASTHEGEESLLLEAFAGLLAAHPGGMRLVLAPRHPARSDSVEAAIAAAGLRCARWTRMSPGSSADADSSWDVLLVDVVGELMGLFAAADVAFVGGTLVPVGGHNLLEPAAFGLPVLCGPHRSNVVEQAGLLEAAGGLRPAAGAAELRKEIEWALTSPEECRRAGEAGREAVRSCGGAVARCMEHIERLLGDSAGAGERAAG